MESILTEDLQKCGHVACGHFIGTVILWEMLSVIFSFRLEAIQPFPQGYTLITTVMFEFRSLLPHYLPNTDPIGP